MTDEILDRLDHLPHDYDLVVTTTDEERRAADPPRSSVAAPARVDRRPDREEQPGPGRLGVLRRLPRRARERRLRHRGQGALEEAAAGRTQRRRSCSSDTCSRTCCASPGYAANVLRLFQQHSSLGMVLPARLPHRVPDARARVVRQQAAAEAEAERLGDPRAVRRQHPRCRRTAASSSPGPRPCARSPPPATGHEDFPDESEYRDGALTHVRRAAGQLRGAQHRAPLPRGDERRAGGAPTTPTWSTARSRWARGCRPTRAPRSSGSASSSRFRKDRRRSPGRAARRRRPAGTPTARGAVAGSRQPPGGVLASDGDGDRHHWRGSRPRRRGGFRHRRQRRSAPGQQHRLLPVAAGLLGDLLPRRARRRASTARRTSASRSATSSRWAASRSPASSSSAAS